MNLNQINNPFDLAILVIFALTVFVGLFTNIGKIIVRVVFTYAAAILAFQYLLPVSNVMLAMFPSISFFIKPITYTVLIFLFYIVIVKLYNQIYDSQSNYKLQFVGSWLFSGVLAFIQTSFVLIILLTNFMPLLQQCSQEQINSTQSICSAVPFVQHSQVWNHIATVELRSIYLSWINFWLPQMG